MVKPLTIEDTSINTRALITNRNKPIVSTVKGSVKSMSNGLTMAFAKPRSRAAITRDPPSAKRSPLKI